MGAPSMTMANPNPMMNDCFNNTDASSARFSNSAFMNGRSHARYLTTRIPPTTSFTSLIRASARLKYNFWYTRKGTNTRNCNGMQPIMNPKPTHIARPTKP